MADCLMLPKCAFFHDKMPDSYGVGAIYKKKYCLGDSSDCARFMVATTIGKEFVTLNLYPNMRDQAKKIIAEHSVTGAAPRC